jgi:hypothetical protein
VGGDDVALADHAHADLDCSLTALLHESAGGTGIPGPVAVTMGVSRESHAASVAPRIASLSTDERPFVGALPRR